MVFFKPFRGSRESLDAKELQDGAVYFCTNGTVYFDYVDADGNLQRKQINEFTGKTSTITLLADSWTGDASPYSQVVTLVNVTANSKIDLQPTAEQLVYLQDEEISLMAANSEGVVAVYAIGNKPAIDMPIQATLTEVFANE